MRVPVRPFLAVGLAVAVSACSDNPLGVNSGDVLSAQEIQSLFDAMSAGFSNAGVSPGAPALASGAAAVPIDQNFTFSAACPAGGSLSISGSANGNIDEQTLLGDLRMEFRYRMTECAVTHEQVTFTVSHAPEIRFDSNWQFGEEALSVSGSERGGFSFTASDGRTGSCAIDLEFSVTANRTTQTSSATVSGEVCGISADGLNPLDVS